ncbi:MAG: hypothetical protein WKG00_20695 [Polyangiaceae bacterium]
MSHASFLRAARVAITSAAPCFAGLGTLALLLAGCGSDGSGGSDGPGGSSSGGATCENGLRDGTSLEPAGNSEFCSAQGAAVPETVSCAYDFQSCGVPLPTPAVDLKRSSNVKEYSGNGAPNVACFAPEGYPAKEESSAGVVTVEGIAKIFSHGCESSEVVIEIFEVDPADATPGALVGTAFTTPEDCEADGVESDKDESCSTASGQPWQCRFSYPDVPTNKELLIKTSGTRWKDLYEYNFYVPNSAAGGTFDKDVRALVTDDYNLIAQTALGSPIAPGPGAGAGEVHDCDDVRLIGAVVDVDVDKKITTYFTSDEDHPLPQTTAEATSTLALYSAIDVAPGPVVISAMGTIGGAPVTVGFHRARVFPDSVTSVTFRGLRPFQVP